MGGIGQNILREIREEGESNYKQPSIIELLKSLVNKKKKQQKHKNNNENTTHNPKQ